MKKLMSRVALGACAMLLAVAAAPAAHAQSDPQQGTFTLTEPLEVGTVILQPGTYVIRVALIDSNRDMLQVTNVDRSKVFATVLSRPHPILDGEVMPENRYVVWATAPGQPRTLKTWFVRDRTTGHDIVYPQARAIELAAAAKEPVIAIPDAVTEKEYKTAPLLVVTPDRTVKPYDAMATQAPKRPAPVAVAAAEERPAKKLPKTASHVPLVAALGLLSLCGAIGLRAIASRTA